MGNEFDSDPDCKEGDELGEIAVGNTLKTMPCTDMYIAIHIKPFTPRFSDV